MCVYEKLKDKTDEKTTISNTLDKNKIIWQIRAHLANIVFLILSPFPSLLPIGSYQGVHLYAILGMVKLGGARKSFVELGGAQLSPADTDELGGARSTAIVSKVIWMNCFHLFWYSFMINNRSIGHIMMCCLVTTVSSSWRHKCFFVLTPIFIELTGAQVEFPINVRHMRH